MRKDVAEGAASPDQVPAAFERLAYSLEGVTREDDARLLALSNELELILHTRLEENMISEMAHVLANAQTLFDMLR